MVGLDIPIMGDPIQVNVTEPIAPLIEHLVYSARDKLTLKQTRHGSCIIGGGWSSRVDPDTGNLYVDQESVSKNLQVAIEMVPILRNVALVRTWPARVNGADDWQPILGEDPMVPGFFTNAFPWMGFSGGPVSSRVTADLMLGRSVNGIPGRLADSVHQNF
jgi:glycine/D-amino acid oxidase-like deaminating enzyme